MKSTKNSKKNPISRPSYADGHIHVHGDPALAQVMVDQGVLSIINCQDPQEWQVNQALFQEGADQVLSFGIHPWEADRFDPSWWTYASQAPVLGEMGLDRVWTDLDYQVQEAAFIQQLDWAQALQRPVILHTSGYEKEVLQIIKNYDLTYYVHWYRQPDYVQDYLDLGAYFSIGPDYHKEAAVADLARYLPDDRLLLETDGLDAVAWAWDKPVPPSSAYVRVLDQLAAEIGQIRGQDQAHIQDLAHKNLSAFLDKPKNEE